jgi:exopolysaccharide biosynthesis polyprenyl glycosylphosphotransferase
LASVDSPPKNPTAGTERSDAIRRRRSRLVESIREEPMTIDLREGDRSTADEGVASRRASGPDGPEPVILQAPLRTIPQQERRAVGLNLRILGHILDAVALAVPFLVVEVLRPGLVSSRVVALFVVVGTVLLWPTHRRRRQLISPSEGLVSTVTRISLAPIVTMLLFTVIRYSDLSNSQRFIDLVAIVQVVALTFPAVMLGRLISYRLSVVARRRGYDLEDTLIVGSGVVGLEVADVLTENPQAGLVPCGFVDGFDDDLHALPLVGRPRNLPEVLRRTGVRHVVLAFGSAEDPELVTVIRRCDDPDVQFFVVPRMFELGISQTEVGHEIDGLPLIPLRQAGSTARTWPAKRAFDLIVASILVVVTFPIMLACAIAVKLSSRGPVFFAQDRIGIGGGTFQILKFRTMRVNSDSNTTWSVDDDERVTWAGRFLRPSHLDELPQLFNVLRGEMSLVGPRPERPHFVEQFSDEFDDYHYRHRVPVGITGWAQINGYWGDTSIERRVRLDNRYIENWSFWRDLVIGLRTIPTLFGRRR